MLTIYSLFQKVQTISESSDKVRKVHNTYLQQRDDDFSELVSKFESMYAFFFIGKLIFSKGEYDTLDGCFELLASSMGKNSAVEPVFLSILQNLMLIPEECAVR